ncbi:MAG: hypothetical protein KGL38_13650, partial [Gemmatimonadota bacterium]|nr:hypothetical protein [Gemmatimonadota bacterium]
EGGQEGCQEARLESREEGDQEARQEGRQKGREEARQEGGEKEGEDAGEEAGQEAPQVASPLSFDPRVGEQGRPSSLLSFYAGPRGGPIGLTRHRGTGYCCRMRSLPGTCGETHG